MFLLFLYIVDVGARVVVTGDSGCGKSALLCNWLRSIQKEQEQIIAYHFVGCTSKSSGNT